MDLLLPVARLRLVVARCRVVLGKARNMVYDREKFEIFSAIKRDISIFFLYHKYNS